MAVAAEHRYQKLNRRQIDEREHSQVISLEQTIANLQKDLEDAQRQIWAKTVELDTVKSQSAVTVETIRKEADERCKNAEFEHELMMKFQRMFSECERGHKKASAILQCLTPDQLEYARSEAQHYYPQLWESKDA